MPDLIDAAGRLNPGLGDSVLNNYDLAGNREMGKRAQRRALVKPLQPGLLARKGRKARSR